VEQPGDPREAWDGIPPPTRRRGIGVLLLFSVLGLFAILNVLLEPYGLLEAGPVLFSVLVWACLTFTMLSRVPIGERVTPTYLVISLYPWVLSALLLANGLFDHSAETTHHTVAISSSGATPIYILHVQSWRPGRASETLYLHRTYFGTTYPADRRYLLEGDPVTVGVKPGALGIPWVSSLSGN
jgi:hypothetical protein